MELISSVLPVLLNILGGLAIFLFAMSSLGSSLQNIVGTKIEYILKRLTDKPYKGMFVGTIITFLTQSSSITVLTLIGLVNVGVLSLERGMGILLGAEIGTTITAQLVTFEIGLMYLPLLIIGLLLSKGKKSNISALGKVIFSFGLLFMGMELMKQGASPIKESQTAIQLFKQLGQTPFLGIIAGALFTAITSSSSATTSLVVALGATQAITLPTGIALIMGANIGTTFLELIAVAGMSLTPKRIGLAQALINIIGVVIIYPFLTPLASFVANTSPNLANQIANAHTIFNVGSSIFFLFFINTIVSIVKKLIPGDTIKIKNGVKYLDNNLISTPHIAITNATNEIDRMGKITLTMLDHLKKHIATPDPSLENAIENKEILIDHLYQKTTLYLNLISQKELDSSSTYRLSQLNHGVSDIERTSDHIKRALNNLSKLSEKETLSPASKKKLIKLIDETKQAYQTSLKSYIKQNLKLTKQVWDLALNVRQLKEKISKSTNIKSQINKDLFNRFIHHVERVSHHGENLAQITIYGA
jgi:phosphate:Na+ symporter